MIYHGIIEVALFIPRHTIRLGMPLLICCPHPNRMMTRLGFPVEVPSNPRLCKAWLFKPSLLPGHASIQAVFHPSDLPKRGPGPSRQAMLAGLKLGTHVQL